MWKAVNCLIVMSSMRDENASLMLLCNERRAFVTFKRSTLK